MYVSLSCVIVDANNTNRQEMANFLTSMGVNVVAQAPGVDGLKPMLGQADAPQLAVVNLDPNPRENLQVVGEMVRQFPATSFMVLSQVVDAHLLMEAMHMGVREFIPLPVDPEKFADGVERVSRIHGLGKRARVIHLVPTVGGCGSTTVACNIAASLAKTAKTVLVDLDLIRGAVASSFDLHPKYTIADVMASADKIDRQLLDNALAVDPTSKLAVLARPDLPEDTQRVTRNGFGRLLGVLGRMFDYIVLDSLMSVDPLYATAISAADLNVVVMQLNVPSAKNAERFVGALRRMGIDSAKIRIVVNRFVKKGWDIEPGEVERALGLKISWSIPNDFKNAIAAINYGQPVVLRTPRAEMSASLFGLASAISGKAA